MSRHDVRHQPFFSVARLREHRGLADLRMCTERGFDFLQLDAKAANLDLLIDAADEVDAAVGQVAAEISGSIEPCRGSLLKGSWRELCSSVSSGAFRYSRASPSPPMNNSPTTPTGTGWPVPVEDVHPCVGNRPADRNRRRTGVIASMSWQSAKVVLSVGP